MSHVLITGIAGFIGSHLARRLVGDGHSVVGVDSLLPAYGGTLSNQRYTSLRNDFPDMRIEPTDLLELSDKVLQELTSSADVIVHLAAFAGVRYAQELPDAYWRANLNATQRLLEFAGKHPERPVFLASSSSIYGDGGAFGPCAEDSPHVGSVKGVYPSTKWAMEIVARQRALATHQPTIAMRFFTVYGAMGRPDMAYADFARRILSRQAVEIYGDGTQRRDFTFIDDLTDILSALINDGRGTLQRALSETPYLALNAGLGNPTSANELLSAVEAAIGREAEVHYKTGPSVDALGTWADRALLSSLIDCPLGVPLHEGIARTFADHGAWVA